MNDSVRDLVRAYLDGTIRRDELNRLEIVLEESDEACEYFLQQSGMVAGLEQIAFEIQEVEGESSLSDAGPLNLDGVFVPPETVGSSDEVELNSKFSSQLPDRQYPRSSWFPRFPDVFGMKFSVILMVSVLASCIFVVINNVNERAAISSSQAKLIARVVGCGGRLQWTGFGGNVFGHLKVGMELPGGYVGALTPESWIAVQFNDGTELKSVGSTLFTFTDDGQKLVHLMNGQLAADVAQQPKGRPMRIRTGSAILEVLETQFIVGSDLDATAVGVTEGKVRVKRLLDGASVEVPANHQLVARMDADLNVQLVPEVETSWSQSYETDGRHSYGHWVPVDRDQPAMLKAAAYLTKGGRTILTASSAVSRVGRAVVATTDTTVVRVEAMVDRFEPLYLGLTLRRASGEFAGRFQKVFSPESLRDTSGTNAYRIEIESAISELSLDPALNDIRGELASHPSNLVIESVWCHTLSEPTGLGIVSFEILP